MTRSNPYAFLEHDRVLFADKNRDLQQKSMFSTSQSSRTKFEFALVIVVLLTGPLWGQETQPEAANPKESSQSKVTEELPEGKESANEVDATQESEASVVDVATQLAGISSDQFLKLVKNAQQSVVVVEMEGRDGKPLGIGSGFIISSNGLIATNLHVIGEARPVKVRLFDDREFPVTQIYGTNSQQDVAVIKIDAEELSPLKLAEPDDLKQGQPVFALGNPRGLEHSVVTGVVSGFREHDDGMSLIQLAIPIEKGNSGGPVLDMRGQVHGLMTLKSQVTENLGYAVKVNAVQELINSPNPVPMTRWMTIGTLNPRLWEPQGDVNWKHRSGVITASGISRGFGGRALCLSRQIPPEGGFELAVDVKITEEDGAAGLVFHSDGGDIHYGFYPSSGSLRLSRFDGPTVYSWRVLKDIRSKHFDPEDWNRLKVRLSDDLIECFCNDELVLTQPNPRLSPGRIGIVKFRHTTAEFKRFEFAEELQSDKATPETIARIEELSTELDHRQPPKLSVVQEYSDLDRSGQLALEKQAKALEQRAQRLRQLSKEIHTEQIRSQIVKTLNPAEGESVNLLKACLLISALDNPELVPDAYEEVLEQMAMDFLESLPADSDDELKVKRLGEFLFKQNGFHGSRTNYYHASNSYINEAIDDREGLPLTLSIIYVEVARRVGLDAAGIGLPGHFIARVTPEGKEPIYIDSFENGKRMTVKECRRKVREFSGFPWNDAYLEPQPPAAIVSRMLRNLIRVANDNEDFEAALRYAKTILAIDPESTSDRLYLAVLCLRTDRLDEALSATERVLDDAPEEIDLERVRELRNAILERRIFFE